VKMDQLLWGTLPRRRTAGESCLLQRGASAIPVTAFHALRLPQPEGKWHGEVDCLNCSGPSRDSTTLGGQSCRAQFLVGLRASLIVCDGLPHSEAWRDIACTITGGSRGAGPRPRDGGGAAIPRHAGTSEK
jgi:hypothetical protein